MEDWVFVSCTGHRNCLDKSLAGVADLNWDSLASSQVWNLKRIESA